jgi:DNA-directed RNA polymerase subunit RPC12/RpoP
MSESFVPLKCPSCGAKLEVYADMERFACGYCGNEVFVQRRGGTVVLKAVTDAIEKVQRGTDRTAQELKLARQTQELTDLLGARAALEVQRASQGAVPEAVLIIAILLGFLFFMSGSVRIGFFALIVCLGCVLVLNGRDKSQIEAVDQRVRLAAEQVRKTRVELGEDG